MSLLYTIICKDHEKVLCEFTEYHGNFEQITRTLIKKSKNYAKASISYDDYYLFHFITENTITYLCMREVTYPYESAFDFLNNIRENFERTYTTEAIETAYAYSFNKEFGQTLQQKMEMYNSNLQSNSINQIDRFRKGEISTREVLLKVEDLLITNEEKMNLIVKKFDLPDIVSNSFFEGAIKVRQRINRKKVQRYILIIFLLMLIAYGITALCCGGLSLDGCFGSGKKEEKKEEGIKG